MADFFFECVEVLGVSQTCEFFGDSINYRNVQEYSARARFKTKTDTIAPLWSGISGLYNYVKGDNFNFVVNGVSLGTGKVISFSSDGGPDVSNKIYDIGFRILKSGDLSYMTGKTYSGYESVKPFLPYLNGINESYEFNQENNRTVSYSHLLDLNFERDFVPTYASASGIKTALLDNLVDLGVLHPYQPPQFESGAGGVKQSSETWDEINNQYSFSESYLYQENSPWMWDYSHSLNFGAEGNTSVTENGTITATKWGSDKLDYARQGWAEVKTGIYSRVSGFYSKWSGEFSSSCPLADNLVGQSTTVNSFLGTIQYDYSYSNDFANQSGYFWSYENSISQDQGGWASVTENGTLKSKQNKVGQIDFLISKFSGVEDGIPSRVNTLYDSTKKFFKNVVCANGTTGVLAETESQVAYSEYPTSIDYSYNYSDDPSLTPNDIFKRVKTTYSDSQPVHLTTAYALVNKEELLQESNQSSLGVLSSKVEIIGSPGVSVSEYYWRAAAEVKVPEGVSYISDEKYSLDPFTSSFNFTRDYTYSKYRAYTGYQV